MESEYKANQFADLRARAEEIAGERRIAIDDLSTEEVKDLVHELQVHQIELELQNEALRRNQQSFTVRKSVEEALRRSEANLRAMLDSAWHSFTLIDRDYRIVDADKKGKQAAKDIFGKRMQPGDSIYDFVLDRDRESFDKNFHRALCGESVTIEKKFEGRRGGTVYYEVRYYPVINDRDEVIGVCMNNEDITRRKQTEEALRRSEQRFRGIFESAAVGIAAVDSEGIVIEANEALARMVGYTPEELKGMNFGEFTHPDDLAREWESIRAMWAAKQSSYTMEKRYLCKAGKIIWVRVTSSTIHSPEGQMLYGIGVVENITKRKQAEEALTKRNRALQTLYEVALDIGVELELPTLLGRVMEHAKTLLNAWQGGGIALYRSQTGLLHIVTSQDDQLPNGTTLSLEKGIAGWVFRHGASQIVEDYSSWEHRLPSFIDPELKSVLSVPLRWKGNITGVMTLGATQDRAPFDADDMRLAEMLAAQAAVAIENAQLYEQAQRDAQIKAELLLEVNHRVKNNLAAIIGLIYMERRRAAQAGQSKQQIDLNGLVSKVQGLATIHSMLSTSGWSPLRLSELAGRVIRTTQQTFPDDKTLFIEIMPSPVCVTADQAHHLALVINELTTNTIKYALCNRDSACVSVRVEVDGKTIQFEFRDDGPGYPEAVLKLGQKNVGLGLAQRIVTKNLGGELTLCNKRGAVTVIRFKSDVEAK